MRQIRTSLLTWVFTWIGLTSIGGGRSAYFYDALVVRRRWVTDEEFVQGLTLSQLLPGPTISNLAVALGHRLRGAAGAACASLGLLLPGALILAAVSAVYFGRGVAPGVGAALRGMGGAVVGFMLVTTARMARGALRGRGAPWIAAVAFLAAGPLRLDLVLVILLVGAASLWLNRPGRRARPGASGDPAGPAHE
ncbi:MAG TPA: chromate transporter [Candidatus Methylomirabilis sp.]